MYNNDDPAYICQMCSNEGRLEEIEAQFCMECNDGSVFVPIYECADCHDISDTVTADDYTDHLCRPCTLARNGAAMDETVNQAWSER